MLLAVTTPNYLMYSSISRRIPIQIDNNKYLAIVKRNVIKDNDCTYSITFFDFHNKIKKYKKTLQFSFKSPAHYTKAWLTNDFLLLTNNCSHQTLPHIAIFNINSRLGQEYTTNFDLMGYRYPIQNTGVRICVSTSTGGYILRPIQWHQYEINFSDLRVDIDLGYLSDTMNIVQWRYIKDEQKEEGKGVFTYQNRNLPANIRKIIGTNQDRQ